MNVSEVKNIERGADGSFDCLVKHPQFGWIHYTADADDSEQFGRELHAEIESGKHGEIAAYIPNPGKSRQDIEVSRRAAYANPHTGSDRLFAEAQRMQLMNEPGWEDVRDQAIQRFQEIQDQYPWE